MKELVLAASVFVASHLVGAAKPASAALIARIGERTYLAVYFFVSLVLLGLLALAYQCAPHAVLWPPHP